MTEVPFNVWDDFYDDGFVPPGEIQETYGYIEEYDELTDVQKEEIVTLVYDFVSKLDMPGVKLSNGGEQLLFEHLTHERLNLLMKELEGSGLSYNGYKINFYSES